MRLGVSAVSAIIVLLAGCTGGPRRYSAPSISASGAASAAMAEFDADGNGKISGAELDKCPSLKAALSDIDTDGDKALSAEEISGRILKWQESKQARIFASFPVLRNGKPLADADVKLVPESFLGGKMPVATGKTSAGGICSASVPTSGPDELPGVPPGFYRVEITKVGEGIPAKYNTETTLGLEISLDASWSKPRSTVPMVFNLKY